MHQLDSITLIIYSYQQAGRQVLISWTTNKCQRHKENVQSVRYTSLQMSDALIRKLPLPLTFSNSALQRTSNDSCVVSTGRSKGAPVVAPSSLLNCAKTLCPSAFIVVHVGRQRAHAQKSIVS